MQSNLFTKPLRGKTISMLVIVVLMFSVVTNTVFAQTVPAPQFPNQPQVPPCPGCDDFQVDDDDPTPTPITSSTPSPSPFFDSTPTPAATVAASATSSPIAEAVGGQVLALSATSAEETNFVLSVLAGLICISLGMKIYRKVSDVA